MDNKCFGPTCTGLTTQAFDKANKCTVKSLVKEDNEGCKSCPCLSVCLFYFLRLKWWFANASH